MTEKPLIDVTRRLHAGIPVWPGDEPFRLEWVSTMARGGSTNVGAVSMGTHAGTHVDAPLHVEEEGDSVDRLPLAPFIGTARVVDVRGSAVIDDVLMRDALARTPRVLRLLFRTGAWTDPETFPTRFPPIDGAAATRLHEAGVLLVGTDAPSVDAFDSSDLPAHHALLSHGIYILENLMLDDVSPGEYDLIALPLRIVDGDAAPIRAVLRPR